ncbi:MAG: Lar family restriction alleviation protein [Oscillospiraceae bacterium]|jgi:Lar family restriction alleviation protein|nr:Lar family restriction alleviation protein [Oscillospiraceae bacterium]MCI1990039.1 Lar family restriction alleviation protein [Oscillospiraceae bacterium]MCI2034789.1 Lar family restriction alleviation protein [Oscillospiraceae bacterium]
MEELKACPFCGSKNVNFTPDDEQQCEDTTTGFIWCRDCDFSSDSFYSQKIAAEKWNRRAAPENKALTLEQLRQMDGEPVWVTFEPEDDGTPIEPCWMLVVAEERRLATEYEWVDWGDQGYRAYARRPEAAP